MVVSSSNDNSASISSNKIATAADAITDVNLSLWNPYRGHKKIHNLVIRKDHKLYSKQVPHCEECKIGFQDHNMAVIKTTGMTEHVDKREKIDKILRKHLPSFPNRMSKVTWEKYSV